MWRALLLRNWVMGSEYAKLLDMFAAHRLKAVDQCGAAVSADSWSSGGSKPNAKRRGHVLQWANDSDGKQIH